MYLKAGSVVRELRLVHIELLCLSVPVLVADRLLGSRIQRRQRRVLRAVSAAPVANRITVWIKVQKLDYADIDIDSITTYISEIDNAGTPEEKEDAIMNALIKIGGNLSLTPEIDYDSSFFFNKNIILKFIKEAMIQIAMQVMSPKIVLLFNINARFLEDTQEGITESTHWEDFFKNFWNILTSCIRKIVDLVIQALLDMIIGQLKPIISLIVKKLMLETIYYYRILLEELITNCVPALPIGTNTRNMVISNVNYADIIPVQKTPPRKR